MENKNGTDAESQGTVLQQVRTKFAEAGSKLPTKGEADKLLKVWKAVHARVEASETQLVTLRAEESEIVLQLANAFGAKSLKIDGTIYDFASRGSTVFFRRKGGEVVEL